MRMPSVMNHNFANSPQANIPRSSFNRSHGYKTTFNAGYLVPFFVDEILPGDTCNISASFFARFATLLFPIMDNMYLDTFFFFVPNRLVWDNWEKFNGFQQNPGDSTSFILPTVTAPNTAAGGFLAGSIYDYLGLPTAVGSIVAQSLPLRAYNLIWNEWFRDENLQNSVPQIVTDGPDDPSSFVLLNRGKRHDYFTSSLPFAQKGQAVELPLGTTAPVIGLATNTGQPTQLASGLSENGSPPGTITYPNAYEIQPTQTSAGTAILWLNQGGPSSSNVPQIYADLSEATAASINSIRQAFQIQKMYERDARGGTRYTEIIRSHFGVISPDARLQRPEYLGGGSTPVNVNPVANTAGGSEPQAHLSAFGTVAATGHGFVKSFTEHGHIIGLMSVRADLTYQQGINRMWARRARFDFYWPAFSHLGEQAVLQQEIYCLGTGQDLSVWGYQEAWADYRYKPSLVTGLFRSNADDSLDAWHLSQDLVNPALNAAFIIENPPTSRVKATSTDPDFILDSFINYIHARPLPTYSVPGLVDHF